MMDPRARIKHFEDRIVFNELSLSSADSMLEEDETAEKEILWAAEGYVERNLKFYDKHNALSVSMHVDSGRIASVRHEYLRPVFIDGYSVSQQYNDTLSWSSRRNRRLISSQTHEISTKAIIQILQYMLIKGHKVHVLVAYEEGGTLAANLPVDDYETWMHLGYNTDFVKPIRVRSSEDIWEVMAEEVDRCGGVLIGAMDQQENSFYHAHHSRALKNLITPFFVGLNKQLLLMFEKSIPIRIRSTKNGNRKVDRLHVTSNELLVYGSDDGIAEHQMTLQEQVDKLRLLFFDPNMSVRILRCCETLVYVKYLTDQIEKFGDREFTPQIKQDWSMPEPLPYTPPETDGSSNFSYDNR